MPFPSVPALWRRLRSSVAARGAGVALVSRVAGAALGLGVHLVLARWGGPSTYGTYSVAVAWVATLSVAVGAGLPETVLRFISTYEVDEAWALLRGIVQRSERLIVGLGTGVAVVGSAGVWAAGGWSSPALQAVVIGLWALPGVTLVRFYTEACRSVDRIVAAYVAPRLLRPALLLSAIAAAVTLPSLPLSGPVVTLFFGAAALPVLVLQRVSFHRHIAERSSGSRAVRFEMRRWMRVALPLFLVTACVILLQKIDVLLIGWIMGVESAGLYQAAVTVASPVGFVLGAVNAVAAPRFARLHTEGDVHAFRRFVSRIAHWLFWPTLALAVVVAGGAPFFLGLLGEAYTGVHVPLLFLTASHVADASFGSVAYLLTMTGHHDDAARVYGLTVALHAVVTATAIYAFGLWGAAAATALTSFCWNAWLHRIVQKRLSVAPSIYSTLWNDGA